MPATATTITDLETAIATLISAIPGIAIFYTWEPKTLDAYPAVVLWPPSFDRGEPGSQEAVEIGLFGLILSWQMTLYVRVDTTTVKDAQTQAKQLVSAIIGRIDQHFDFGGLPSVRDARVTTGEAILVEPPEGTVGPQILMYDTRLACLVAT